MQARGFASLWERIAGDGKRIFMDLKVPEIGSIVADVVRDLSRKPGVEFLTLHQSVQPRDVAMACAARGGGGRPVLLTVPFVSSLDASDFARLTRGEVDRLTRGGSLDTWILARTRDALDHGCDGVIASGEAIPAVPDGLAA